jgi:hypothetical protein
MRADLQGPASTADEDDAGSGSRSLRALPVVLVGVSVLIFAIWGWLAVVHVDDRYRIDQVSGVHMALAWDANHGLLYPPLYDGRTYGGTRYMPVPIAVDALAARVSGSYLVGGKVLSYAYFAVLIGAVVILLRRARCPWALTIGLAAMIPVTETGLAASMDARSDALPVLLQVAAVGLIIHRERRASTLGAALLAAVAFASKLTAVWGAIAIVVWLFLRDRRRAVTFAAAYVAASTALITIFVLASDGRLVSNVLGLSGAGVGGLGALIRSPYRFFHEAIPQALPTLALVPFAGVAVWWTGRRDVSVWALALGVYVVVLMVMLADRGVGWNQFIDLVVLLALIAGEWLGGLPGRSAVKPLATALLGLTILWGNVSGLAFLFGPDIKETRDAAFAQAITPDPLAGAVSPKTRLLSEDPYVPVSLDRRAVVLDPFMLIEIGRRQPAAIADLVDRIRRRAFDLVVLRVRVDDPSMRSWFDEEAFGSAVADALRANYRYDLWQGGYFLYVPR